MKKTILINKIIEALTDRTESFEAEPWLISRTLYLVSAVNSTSHIELVVYECVDDLAFYEWLKTLEFFGDLEPHIILPKKALWKMSPHELITHAEDTHEREHRTTTEIEDLLMEHLKCSLKYIKMCQEQILDYSPDNEWVCGRFSEANVQHATLSKFLEGVQ